MSELNFTKLADAPVLDEVPDAAKVYAEVNGKVYRVAGDNLGGTPTAIFKVNVGATHTATCENMTYEECKAIFLAGGQVNARLQVIAEYGILDACSLEGMYYEADGEEMCTFAFVCSLNGYYRMMLKWLPDGTITTDGGGS